MTTQNQTTTAQASTDKVSTSLAEAMKTATISDETRAYLILIGKLHDLYDEGYKVTTGDLHGREIDERLLPYHNGLSDAIRNIEEVMAWRMTESYGGLDFYEHRQL